ncbi:MAG: c-type cytochrome [Xanthobacteraceae bacterium]
MARNVAASVFVATAIVSGFCLPAFAQGAITGKAQLCDSCHGNNGLPVSATTPIVWGQQANYLYKDLHDFHSGERSSPIMGPLVKTLNLQDLRSFADYFAAKPWPARQSNAAATRPPQASIMCEACHGKDFEGGAPAPRLAGLSYEYLLAAMNGFADGQRTNNLDMPGFMQALSESQREAIAHYLSAL